MKKAKGATIVTVGKESLKRHTNLWIFLAIALPLVVIGGAIGLVFGLGVVNPTYQIEVTQTDNGNITCSSDAETFATGSDITYVITPELGYQIDTILVDNEEEDVTTVAGNSQVYIFENVRANHTITATFTTRAYTITYNLNDGTNGANPTTYTIETSAITLANPTKTGSTFGGWYTTNNFSGTAVTAIDLGSVGNKTFYAKWALNEYTITFDSNEGTAVSPIVADYATAVTEPADPTRQATAEFTYAFAGWYTDDETFENEYTFDTMPAGNITVYAEWTSTTNQYTVTFNYGDDETSDNTVDYGTAATVPSDLTKTQTAQYSYAFSYWSLTEDGEEYTGSLSNVTANVELYAVYTSILRTYTVTFMNNGVVYDEQTIAYGSDAEEPETDPTYTGHTFTGWSGTWTDIHQNETVTAQYDKNIYTVTFVNWDDSVLEIEQVAYGDPATAPEETPTKPADLQYTYRFDVWDVDFSNITGDLTITAQFIPATEISYTVTFQNPDTDILSFDHVTYNQIATYYGGNTPTQTSTAQYDYTFTGWEIDGVGIDLSTYHVVANVIITAVYEPTLRQYTVTFDSNEGTAVPQIVADYGTTITEPADPTREGFTFAGWYTDDETFVNEYEFTTMPAENTTVYAKWNPFGYEYFGSYKTINVFDYNSSDNLIEEINVSSFNQIFVFNYEESLGYIFELYAGETLVQTDSWSFVDDKIIILVGGHEQTINILSNGDLWFCGDGVQVSSKNETTPAIAVMYIDTLDSYFVHFENDIEPMQAILPGEKVDQPADPIQEEGEYTFVGWYSDFACENEFDFDTQLYESTLIYAKWDIVVEQFTVTFYDHDGVFDTQTSIEYGSPATAPTIDPANYEVISGDTTYIYSFDHWDTDFSNVTTNLTVNAVYTFDINTTGTTVTIPGDMDNITPGIFSDLDVNNFEIDGENDNYSTEDGLLYDKDKETIIAVPSGKEGTLDLSSSTTLIIIGERAFENSTLLEVILPSTVTTIGSSAFSGSTIQSLSTSSDSTTSALVTGDALAGMTDLTEIVVTSDLSQSYTLPDLNSDGIYYYSWVVTGKEVSSIKDKGGYVATPMGYLAPPSITEGWNYESISGQYYIAEVPINLGEDTVVIPSVLTIPGIGDINIYGIGDNNDNIYNANFIKNIENYSNIVIESGIIDIGFHALRDCNSLVSVIIPNSVMNIETTAFAGCSMLTSITIPDSVTSIGSGAFMGCSSLRSVIINGNITMLKNEVFSLCSNLEDIIIPNTVTYIGELAFGGCSSLRSVIINDDIEYSSVLNCIKDSAFENCTSLISIVIPQSIQTIEGEVFRFCSNLTTVTVNATIPPTLGFSVFSNTGITTIYVPVGCVAAYQAAWSSYSALIQEIVV